MKTLLLGLGNDILGDDAVGWHAIQQLWAELGSDPAIDRCETTRTGPDLLDLLEGYTDVAIVDSIHTGQAEVGTVQEFDLPLVDGPGFIAPHQFGLAETLCLGRELHLNLPEHISVFAIEVRDPFAVKATMDAELEARLPTAVHWIVQRLEEKHFAHDSGVTGR